MYCTSAPDGVPSPCLKSPSSKEPDTSWKKPRKRVFFSNRDATVEVLSDQESPISVWNVYAPVRYVTRREQRLLEKQRASRSQVILECCTNLFESQKNIRTRKIDTGSASHLKGSPRNSSLAASASFVMSLWSTFPAESRPPISLDVEKALEYLFRGTNLCLFNEEKYSPVECFAALRLLRSVDADESSMAIYNCNDTTSIQGYVPLAFISSVTAGLEHMEREKYCFEGTVSCRFRDGTEGSVMSNRAFTLHCRVPHSFYVSFIVFNDSDWRTWMCVLEYFVLLNSYCRTAMQSFVV